MYHLGSTCTDNYTLTNVLFFSDQILLLMMVNLHLVVGLIPGPWIFLCGVCLLSPMFAWLLSGYFDFLPSPNGCQVYWLLLIASRYMSVSLQVSPAMN